MKNITTLIFSIPFKKIALLLAIGFAVLTAAVPSVIAFAGGDYHHDDATGSITICKIALDAGGEVIDVASAPGTTFTIPGITPSPVTSEGEADGELSDTVFTAPLTFTKRILAESSADDAECVTYDNLVIADGGYYYGEETIASSAEWLAPKYNDQFTTSVYSTSDFYVYNEQLFDTNAGNDGARNKNADGHIKLNEERPDRTLVVLNQMKGAPEPECKKGGVTGSVDGGTATLTVPANGCPVEVSFTTYSHEGSIRPFEDQILIENVTDSYGPGTHAIGPLELSCNWQADLYYGPLQYPLASYGHSKLIAYDYVEHQNCPPPEPPPTCALDADPNIITRGDATELSWETTNATSFSIDQGVGSSTPVNAGSVSVSPSTTTLYTGTAIGPGGTATCTKKVKVEVPPNVPACTLSAAPSTIDEGDSTTLSWTTSNGTSFSLTQGIGSVTPVGAGSVSVSPTATTTYTGTVTGSGGTASCEVTVAVVPPPVPPAPTCEVSIAPGTITAGASAILSWASANADSLIFDNDLGTTTPVSGGSRSVSPGVTTTYTGTFSGSGGTTTCSATINVSPPGGGGGGPSCQLSIAPSTITTGGSATLAWGGVDITAVFIDNGVGTTSSVSGSQSIAPASGTHTYTGTFTTSGGAHLSCSASLTVNSSGCISNCGGGGGGGGGPPPNVLLTSLPRIGEAPLAFLYLSQIPYTGIELGPLGTTLYWLALVLWSLVMAYLALFKLAPFAARKMQNFAAQVSEVVNAPTLAPAVNAQAAMPVMTTKMLFAKEPPRGYSTYEGFKSFAKNGALTIEDIVKGLSREHSTKHAESAREQVEPIYENVEPVYENVEPIEEGSAEHFSPATTDTRGFITALIEGDRGAVFAALRAETKNGGSPERFITKIACALDDAYRSRIDGSPADADIVRVVARLDTGTLEKVVVALSNAIDSSYSTGITGAKLALTRALAALGA